MGGSSNWPSICHFLMIRKGLGWSDWGHRGRSRCWNWWMMSNNLFWFNSNEVDGIESFRVELRSPSRNFGKHNVFWQSLRGRLAVIVTSSSSLSNIWSSSVIGCHILSLSTDWEGSMMSMLTGQWLRSERTNILWCHSYMWECNAMDSFSKTRIEYCCNCNHI